MVQVEPSLGEPVFVANRPVAVGRCDEDSLFHEASEPARENVGRDGEISSEFVESAGPEEGLSKQLGPGLSTVRSCHSVGLLRRARPSYPVPASRVSPPV